MSVSDRDALVAFVAEMKKTRPNRRVQLVDERMRGNAHSPFEILLVDVYDDDGEWLAVLTVNLITEELVVGWEGTLGVSFPLSDPDVVAKAVATVVAL